MSLNDDRPRSPDGIHYQLRLPIGVTEEEIVSCVQALRNHGGIIQLPPGEWRANQICDELARAPNVWLRGATRSTTTLTIGAPHVTE